MDYEPPQWISDYIGVQYKKNGRDIEDGVDCWGLIKSIYSQQFNISLPSYDNKYEKHGKQQRLHDNDYSFLEADWRKIPMKNRQLGDLILFDMNNVIFHVGMVVAKYKFLHVHSDIETVLEELSSLRWKNRISEFYRHRELSVS